jgi:hypothetical protein
MKYLKILLLVRKERFGGTFECCGRKSPLDCSHRLAGFIFNNSPALIQFVEGRKGE